MIQNFKKYRSFTLIEVLLVTVIIWFIFPVMITVYTFMIRSNRQILARQTAIQQWYEFFEKLNILMQDYTIDYEEYFNRQRVWCIDNTKIGDWFKRNIWLSWYCTEFTAYWNENSTERKIKWWGVIPGNYHDIYNCTSSADTNLVWRNRAIKDKCWKFWSKQSFGQYKALFTDVWDVTRGDDDKDLWDMVKNNINAIVDPENIQELYLISHDGKSRLYFRRRLVDQQWEFAQYRIQMLRLRWFDAGQKHSFAETSNNEWLYDGQIDTWACDTSMWFEPKTKTTTNSVWWAYADYYLPQDVDDCWIDLTYWNTNAYTRNISVYPLWDPDLFWAKQERQINPYMKILLVNSVYFPTFYNDMSIGSSIADFKVPLQTTINMKDFYKE